MLVHAGAARRSARRCAGGGAGDPRRGRRRSGRGSGGCRPTPGVTVDAARGAARPRRLLRAWRTLSPAVVAADDGDSGAGGRGARGRGVQPVGRSGRAGRRGRRPAWTAFFRLGGAHAVAAMAYGTATVPRVSKIVGPGNRWVSAAKALVARDCPIDFYAGPTEILIVADRGPARVDRRRSHRPGRARSRRPRGVHHVEAGWLASGGRGGGAPAAGRRAGRDVAVEPRRHHRHPHRWTRP